MPSLLLPLLLVAIYHMSYANNQFVFAMLFRRLMIHNVELKRQQPIERKKRCAASIYLYTYTQISHLLSCSLLRKVGALDWLDVYIEFCFCHLSILKEHTIVPLPVHCYYNPSLPLFDRYTRKGGSYPLQRIVKVSDRIAADD